MEMKVKRITELENRSIECIQSKEVKENSLKKKWIKPQRPSDNI